MGRKWTQKERQKQADAIKKWRPWDKATGPKTAAGKEKSAMNAFTHGLDSREGEALRRALKEQQQLLQTMLINAKLPKGREDKEQETVK